VQIDLNTVFTVLLGGGAIATCTAIVKGITSLRSGATARQRQIMDALASSNERNEQRATRAEADRDFWHSTAAGYHYQLVQAGYTPNPVNATPPSQRLPLTTPTPDQRP